MDRMEKREDIELSLCEVLELGMDIGALDAAVLTGYPGTRASMWQQAGRAGRRSEESLGVGERREAHRFVTCAYRL